MDAEGRFFAALLHQESLAEFRALDRAHLVEEFHPVYDFVLNFLREQGRLPRKETVQHAHPALIPDDVDALETPAYWRAKIQEEALRRAMEEGFGESVVGPLSESRVGDALDGAKAVVSNLVAAFRRGEEGQVLDDLSTGLRDRWDAYKIRQKLRGATGVPFPFEPLNEATGGIHPGEVAAILARPNLGKTLAAAFWAMRLVDLGYRVLFCSMESPPQSATSRHLNHRVLSGVRCAQCGEVGVSPEQPCPAASVPRQRFSMRLDALGAGISLYRFSRGELTPRELRDLREYYRRLHDSPPRGSLRVVSYPFVSSLVDFELEVMGYQPDVAIWDSAYLAIPKHDKQHAANQFVVDLKRLAERTQIPTGVTWHFNRDVDEKATSASMNSAALADNIGRSWDHLIGLFRPPEVEQAREAIWRVLKTRDGAKAEPFKTRFEIVDGMCFDVIPGLA